jgi:hypothetical protein
VLVVLAAIVVGVALLVWKLRGGHLVQPPKALRRRTSESLGVPAGSPMFDLNITQQQVNDMYLPDASMAETKGFRF